MKLINLVLIISWFGFLSISSIAQEIDLNKLIPEIEKGQTERSQLILLSLEKDNQNSSTYKYLKALLTQDGFEAAKIYKDIVYSNEESEWKDDALFKLYQFHYSRGEFNESDKYARMLRESFPESIYISRLQRNDKIGERILNFRQDEKISKPDTVNLVQGEVSYNQSIQPNIQQVSKNKLAIQVGAFSNEANALRFSKQFLGYKTKVKEKSVNNKKLFVVLVGEYESEVEAKNALERLKKIFKVEGLIINLN